MLSNGHFAQLISAFGLLKAALDDVPTLFRKQSKPVGRYR